MIGVEDVVILKYNHGMKTAISIPDDLFQSADTLAEKMGVTRSRLYSTAVAEYVAKHRDDEVTQQLNAVHADEPSDLDDSLRRAQARSVGRGKW